MWVCFLFPIYVCKTEDQHSQWSNSNMPASALLWACFAFNSPIILSRYLGTVFTQQKGNVNFFPLRCRHFFPTYENDTLLCSLEDDDDDDEEGSWNTEETKKNEQVDIIQAPSSRIRIFLNQQLFLSGFKNVHVHMELYSNRIYPSIRIPHISGFGLVPRTPLGILAKEHAS